jgi:hypothetical protein
MRICGGLVCSLILGLAQNGWAALIVNAPQPITHTLAVQFIGVADDDGGNPAPLLGSLDQQSKILGFVNTIWSQAGIALNYSFRADTFDDTFVNSGDAGGNNPRPESDLDTSFALAGLAGNVLAPASTTINILMVSIVPSFSALADNQGAGLAFLGQSGMSLWAGPNLPTSAAGREGLGKLIAHEIGHNLGLDHLIEAENLLQEAGSPNPGERLSQSQISFLLTSPLLVAVPEPASAVLLLMAGLALLRRRRIAAKH